MRVLAEHPADAPHRLEKAHQDIDQRRLALAVFAKQATDGALFDREVKILVYHLAAVTVAQPADLDDGFGR